jgi:hypothetical protein
MNTSFLILLLVVLQVNCIISVLALPENVVTSTTALTTDLSTASSLNEASTATSVYDLKSFEIPEFCWKDSYTRPVGKIPKTCKSGYDRIGYLCYKKCPNGYKRYGFDCHQKCPSGSKSQGLFCRWNEYSRGKYK